MTIESWNSIKCVLFLYLWRNLSNLRLSLYASCDIYYNDIKMRSLFLFIKISCISINLRNIIWYILLYIPMIITDLLLKLIKLFSSSTRCFPFFLSFKILNFVAFFSAIVLCLNQSADTHTSTHAHTHSQLCFSIFPISYGLYKRVYYTRVHVTDKDICICYFCTPCSILIHNFRLAARANKLKVGKGEGAGERKSSTINCAQ